MRDLRAREPASNELESRDLVWNSPHPVKRGAAAPGQASATTSVIDFTDPRSPREIAYVDVQESFGGRGPWSSYWYNGFIYVSDRGCSWPSARNRDRRADRSGSLSIVKQPHPPRSECLA